MLIRDVIVNNIEAGETAILSLANSNVLVNFT